MLKLIALLLLPLVAACASMTETRRPAFTSDRISVEVRGEGPDVVLIPGLSSAPRVWEGAVAAIPGYRYHLVHVAGFAGKPAGANASGPVLDPVAAEVARYIDEAGLRRPALVGHSMGGAWAMMVAARHPDLASRVMVVDMLPFMGPLFGGANATAESVRPIAAQIRQGFATQSGAARRATVEQTIAGMVRTESERPQLVADSLSSDRAVSGQAFYELIVADLRPELRNIDVPMTVLFVHPPGAPVTVEQMEGFYRASFANAPQTVLTRIAGAWHFLMFDQPDVFQRELRLFLAPMRR